MNKKVIRALSIVIIFIIIFVLIDREKNKKIYTNPSYDFGEFNKRMSEEEKTLKKGPIDIDPQDKKYIDIVSPMVDKTFNDWFKKEGGVLDYKINNIKYVIANIYTSKDYQRGFTPEVPINNPEDIFSASRTKDAFIINVNFSVKSKSDPVSYSTWIAGNGEESSDGWILNKSIYLMVDKINGQYAAEIMGTGL